MRVPVALCVMVIILTLFGCGDEDLNEWIPKPPSPQVQGFVAEEGFSPLQYSHQILNWNGIEVFRCSYGEGLDCPSGCFHSSACGLAYTGQIGWLGFTDYHGHVSVPERFYDFLPEHELLYDVDTWILMIDKDAWTCWNMFLPALAADPDTGREALLALSAMIYTHMSMKIAENLVSNSAVAGDAEILGILASLPVMEPDYYLEVRQQAQALLDGLDTNGIARAGR